LELDYYGAYRASKSSRQRTLGVQCVIPFNSATFFDEQQQFSLAFRGEASAQWLLLTFSKADVG
jgi:hypothetical protein